MAASTSTSQDDTSQEAIMAALWDRITKAEEYKTAGNEMYNAKDVRGAMGKYHRAMLYVRGLDASLQKNCLLYLGGLAGGAGSGSSRLPEEMQKRVSTIEQGCLNNLAACLLLQEQPNYEKVISYCNRVLEMTPDNPKALYRKGCSLYHLGCYEEAYDCLKKAQLISKSDPNIRKYLTMAKDKMTDINNAQRTMYQGMFNKTSTQSDG